MIQSRRRPGSLPNFGAKEGDYAVVSIRRIFFWRSFSSQLGSTSRQWFIGAPVPYAVCIATRPRGASPTINVLWGALNLIVGYLLVSDVGEFHLRNTQDALVLGVGGLLTAIMLSRAFGRIYGGPKAST